MVIHNRQRTCSIKSEQLRRLTHALLSDLLQLPHYELGLNLVGSEEMARVNHGFLGHEGSTDVITFDHSQTAAPLHGELFICLDDALAQSRRFRTTWQSELARYIVHGVLHLRGHDDHHQPDRRVMKREENRLLRALSGRMSLTTLGARRATAKARNPKPKA